jgi:poly(3-hydroxybutyrate) depolymerase
MIGQAPPLRAVATAALLFFSALIAVACTPEQQKPSAGLPRLGAKLSQTSVSGISSGAYMAGQFQLAHSQNVVGAGIIAGGPYGCAESLFADMMPGPGTLFLNVSKATNGCMLNALQAWGVPDPQQLASRARRLAEQGRIDPIAGVKADRVYLFSGSEDRTVVPAIVAAAAEFYKALGLPAESIEHVTKLAAGHAFVTEEHGLACAETGKPYVVDCDYDQASALLRHIYGELNPPSASPAGEFVVFDQRPFTRDLGDHGLGEQGIAYVPEACRSDEGCRVHVAFHGCDQSRTAIGDAFARETGYDRWADTNRLIVLFPQTTTGALNPQSCWDWWGYTGRDYLTRKAPQIIAVNRMLEHLTSPRVGS